MKISELPQEIKEKALEYQRNNKDKNFNTDTNFLMHAFEWEKTKEGRSFWRKWNETESLKPKSLIHSFANEIKEEYKTKPFQYAKGIDTFQRMESNCTKDEILAFCKGNIDKYNWREKSDDLNDFKKIIDYANFAIKQIIKNPSL